MMSLARRNVKLFLRDRSAVFFSFMAVFIVVGLYVFFLGNSISSNYKEVKGVDALISSWIMAGIIAVASVTTTLGAFGIMVEDRANKIISDFSVAPVKRYELIGGYIISSFSIGLVMSIVTLILAEFYIVSMGGELLSAAALVRILGILVLSVLASSSMIFFMVSFFKSHSAFGTASTIVGTLLGFLIGIYIPIGSLPKAVQLIMKIFPVSHAASLLRQTLMAQPMAVSFENAPAEMVESFYLQMGNVYQFGDYTTNALTSVMVLLVTTVLFFGLSLLFFSKKNEH